MYFVKSPIILCKLYQRNEIWSIDTQDKVIYLTFDDGPVDSVTPWVLNILDRYNAHATFFCVGENVLRNRKVFDSIQSHGHSVGNHTYNHLNGWRSPLGDYVNNVMKCNEMFPTTLFRPPYGRISRKQMLELKAHFTLIFWSVLTGDFDPEISPAKCLNNAVINTKPGSIVVFHDSIRAWPNLKYALPAFLEHFKLEGYEFRALPYGIKTHKTADNLLLIDYN
jgi:peptidoglycan/xylan/chitin deacetylase (PgdA/CDA1 family)